MSGERRRFRAGDAVSHEADVYMLACDEDDRGRVWPAGWPCSPLHAAECALVEAATDEARLAMLRDAIKASETQNYWPGCLARDQLHAESPTWQPKPVTHEWARGSFGLSVDERKRGGFVDVAALLLDGWTVSPWTPRAGFPATRPIEPSERGDS